MKKIQETPDLEKIVKAAAKPSLMKKIAAIATTAAAIFTLGTTYKPGDAGADGVDPGVGKNGTSTYARPGQGNVGVDTKTGKIISFPGDGKVGFTSDGKIIVTPGHQNEEETPQQPQYQQPAQTKPQNIPPTTKYKMQKRKGKPAELKDTATGIELVFVDSGCFQMGDTFGDGWDNEKPVHKVCVNDFYIGKYEVTQGQWKAVNGNNPSKFKDCGDNCPVEQVSWNDAQDFINKLNNKTGKKYRLATEAEWEYAARSGGKSEKYAGTSNESELGDYAWYDKNSGSSLSKTHSVGQKKPNGLGLYDMSGNVWEWVSDWKDDNYYKNSLKNDPKGPNTGTARVLRGGSLFLNTRNMRTAVRSGNDPGRIYDDIGFRLVLSAE